MLCNAEVRSVDRRLSSYTGCLLGLAAGDAMGYAVDNKTLEQIRQDYGPDGLLGYDLVNGYADISSYTQLAAFVCNGLLLGLTHGQMTGSMDPFVRYIAVGERDWARLQRYRRGQGERVYSWIARSEPLRARRCMDTLMLDTVTRGNFGTMEEQRNRFQTPGSITAAVPVGLFFDPERSGREEIQRLGAEAIAITHGNPMAFLSGAALAHIISRLTWDGETDLKAVIREAVAMVQERFGQEYRQAAEVAAALRMSMSLAASHTVAEADAMEQLQCDSVCRCLAGAVYAVLCHPANFDEAMITAVNHSGCSAAVGAVAGAILGAALGKEGLPEFYLECLECGDILTELAQDMFQGCPMAYGSRLFDIEWDEKYVNGGI